MRLLAPALLPASALLQEPWLVGVWLGWNAIVFALFGYDKAQARRGGRRVPEKTLLTCAACAGVFGGFVAMFTFRHKTRKASFFVPMLLIAVAWGAVAYALA